MKRTGKKTAHPGVLRIGKNSYQVRATAKCPKTRKRYEKERRVHDVSLAKALDIQNAMRLQLEAFVEEQAAANDNTITPVRRQGQLAEDMTFTAYAEKWLLHVERAGRKRPHVVDGDIIRLESLILPLLGDLYISEIGKPELAMWMNKITQLKKPNGEPYAKNTLHSGWRLLASMLRDAETLIGVKNDGPNNLRFRVVAPTTRPKDTLTRDELERVLRATDAESPDIRAMIWVSGTTGMRFGELSGLTWEDVDFDKGVIHVRRSVVKKKVFPTKTNSNRSVPLLPAVAEILEEHRAWLQHQLFAKDNLVFPSRAGTHREPSCTIAPLRRCAARAGVDKVVTNQALRRTVNNLVRQTSGEIAARAITGHATQAMTEHYSDVTVAEKQQAGTSAFGAMVMRKRRRDDEDCA